MQIGEVVFLATPGTYVMKPRGVPHTFWNAGPAPARIQEIITPAGFERYFPEVAKVRSPGGPPEVGRLMEIAARYGLTLHIERLEEVMQAHNISLQ